MELRNRLLDPEKVRRGVWVEYEGAEFLVRRFPNPEGSALQFRHYEEWRAANGEKEEVPDEVRTEATDRMLAECVLLDWRGVMLDGEPLEATDENRLMAIKGDPELRNFVVLTGMNNGHYRAQRIAKEAEDLGNGSPGPSRGARGSRSSKR